MTTFAIRPSEGSLPTPNGLAAGKPKNQSAIPRSLPDAIDIIDIRSDAVAFNLKQEIFQLFRPQEGPRQLPTLLLYDEKGLQLFEKITYLEEYYLTNSEIQLLRRDASNIAKSIPNGSMFIELGSGNLRKICLVLQALDDAGKDVDYYALDLSREELERTLAQLPTFEHVKCHGLLGTYDDGREWLKQSSLRSRPKCIASLGSSLGNFSRDGAASFLRDFTEILRPSDTLLVGLDSCANPSKVYHAYNDKEGVTHQFILNGLLQANEVLGEEAFKPEDWTVIGEYVYDVQGGHHQAFYAPVRDVTVLGEHIPAGERIKVEQSLKFSAENRAELLQTAGLVEKTNWITKDGDYGLHLFAKANSPFDLRPSQYADSSVPTLKEWQGLWEKWDSVTRGMLPDEELLGQPIKLRNACIFYLGHIPTFLDIQLTKTTGTAPTDPSSYSSIFERGVDPDVDNPEHCHAHSEIPDEWPLVDEILAYQYRVRSRLESLYSRGIENIPRDVSRAIWVGFEHEAMHLETLLYMMLQSDKTAPPPNVPHPDFEEMAKVAASARVENAWVDIPAHEIPVGMDDPESDLTTDRPFGWDNEKPSRSTQVQRFQASGQPITNKEYGRFMLETDRTKLPASWAITQQTCNGVTNGHVNGDGNHTEPLSSFLAGKSVRTVYGLVPLKYALDWPVFASYDELAACATWKGGRIPTAEEVQSIYAYVDYLKRERAENKLGKTLPAVNAHLVNNGVQETPPTAVIQDDDKTVGESSSSLYADLVGANVGFQHWHPTPVTAHGNDRPAGRGELGGVWEWTSSPLRKHEGFEPMALYPNYTADFFDGKHNIVLGGSWATHPRIAGRKSFVNWYQRNYPYAWAGARVVRDI
ncbi:C-type lectin protein [Microdochium bolleyi]|uniref:C-type lectin protein n=1 Tax=Microdochium bolleyi TaxID=196109 RepID=A0A136IMB2_9PEZI|nr:C-type lectin protein [Microdochium bolleyi]